MERLFGSSCDSWLERGDAARAKGDYPKALECYEKARQKDSQSILAWNNKGLVYYAIGRYQDAIDCYRLAQMIDSENANLLGNLGFALRALGEYDEAINLFNKAFKVDSCGAVVLCSKGYIHFSQGRYSEARSCYKQALAINPNYVTAINYLCNVSFCEGKFDEARQYVEQALSFNAENPYTLQNKGLLAFQNTRGTLAVANLANAQDALVKSDKSSTSLAALLTIRGQLYLSINALLEAQVALEAALRASPDYAIAKQAMAALNGKSPNATSSLPIIKPTPNLSPVKLGGMPDLSNSLPNLSGLNKPTLASEFSPSLIIPNQELVYGRAIGKGAFGEVFVGTWQNNPVAIKRFLISNLSLDAENEFKQEVTVMANLCSDHIVFLKGIVLDTQPFCLVLAWMSNGSLYDVLHSSLKNEELPWHLRERMALEISQGLSLLHSKKILHRDLKSLNVLLDENLHAKLADFGLAKVRTETRSKSTVTNEGVKGSLCWLAPELFGLRPRYSEKSDIYSYAMVLWEIVSRKIPYADVAGESEIRAAVKEGEREEIPAESSPRLAKLINWCWSHKPEERPTAAEIVNYLMNLEEGALSIKEKHWHFDARSRQSALEPEHDYQLFDASDKDKEKVVQYYLQSPVPGYDIKAVRVIYNPHLNRGFADRLALLQKCQGNAAFAPKWLQECKTPQERSWRDDIHHRFEKMAAPYADSDYPDVKLLPLWHGTRPQVMESILKTGYANLSTTDNGFFGKGLYSSCEAEYAYRVYATNNYSQEGVLLVNWVTAFSAYPVMDGDIKIKQQVPALKIGGKLGGKGNYQNYDAHFVPVVPKNANNPHEQVYYPCAPNQLPKYTEVVVFEPFKCLPRYVVELQSTSPKSLSSHAYSQPPKALMSALFKPEGIGFAESSHSEDALSNLPASSSLALTMPKSFELSLASIAIDRTDKNKRLGKGVSGTVYLSRWQNRDVAVKEMHADISDVKAIERFKREAKILANLPHPNIVLLYGVNFEQSFLIVMEYCSRGTLRKLLVSTNVSLDINQQIKFGLEIAQGLACIHSNGIMHLDLKPENILVSNEGHLKLTDFGISIVQTQVNNTVGGERGTYTYMAPEILDFRSKEEAFTEKADIYSYGLILWELVTRIKPYHDQVSGWVQQQMLQLYELVVKQQKRPEPAPKDLVTQKKTSNSIANLIGKCWAQRQQDRPTSQEIVQVLEESKHFEL